MKQKKQGHKGVQLTRKSFGRALSRRRVVRRGSVLQLNMDLVPSADAVRSGAEERSREVGAQSTAAQNDDIARHKKGKSISGVSFSQIKKRASLSFDANRRGSLRRIVPSSESVLASAEEARLTHC